MCIYYAQNNVHVFNDRVFDPPPKRWTPLLSRKVFYGYGTSSISG